jgi:aspartyl-tRNA(Asn)/glutamyl-tRNA(Gln) amidotransferase subunit A
LAVGVGVASLGTDAAGSVRIPAAFTNVCALKPTTGRVPMHPYGPMGTLSHVGPMARTVDDLALLFEAIARPDARDGMALPHRETHAVSHLHRGVRGLRVAYSPAFGHAQVDQEIAHAVRRAVHAFADLGAEIEEVDPPLDGAHLAMRVFLDGGVLQAVEAVPPERRDLLDSSLLAAFEKARARTLTDHMRAQATRAQLASQMSLFHQRYDLLVTPATASLPFDVGVLAPAPYGDDWLAWCPFTHPFNLTGQPAVVVPCGFSRGHLPIGLQIVGPFDHDAQCLQAAFAYQEAHPTTDRFSASQGAHHAER